MTGERNYWFTNEKENLRRYDAKLLGCLYGASAGVFLFIALLLCFLFGSCKSVKYVQVPEIHTIESHHTDSIHEVDSIICEKETTIMMLDSAAMAEYGIKLANAERAWLVKTKELEREISRLAKIKADTIHEIDSIPYPIEVEVIKEVEKPPTRWQKLRLTLGDTALIALFGLFLYGCWKIYRKFFVV